MKDEEKEINDMNLKINLYILESLNTVLKNQDLKKILNILIRSLDLVDN